MAAIPPAPGEFADWFSFFPLPLNSVPGDIWADAGPWPRDFEGRCADEAKAVLTAAWSECNRSPAA